MGPRTHSGCAMPVAYRARRKYPDVPHKVNGSVGRLRTQPVDFVGSDDGFACTPAYTHALSSAAQEAAEGVGHAMCLIVEKS